MKVLVNTKPLLNQKTGIGYCIQNLVEQLQEKKLDLVLSHDLNGVGVALATKSFSAEVKKVLGSYYPHAVAAFVYNLLISRYSKFDGGAKEKKESFDIYHEMSHCVLPGIFEKTDIRYFIADIHDLSPVRHPALHLDTYVKSVSNSLNELLSADLFIVKSQFIKEEASEYFDIPAERIRVLPNAPSFPYRNLDRPRGILRAELCRELPGFPDRPFILYTGTIEPRKNLETLIRAFAQFRYSKDFTLILAGGFGWKYESVKKLPSELGIKDRVRFLGYQPSEIFELLYNAADFFVYPSLYEGFGMPNVEAMQCGLPVITSNASCLPEVVGDAALLFDPMSPDELVAQMERLVDSPELREELRQKGFQRGSEYSWETIGEQLYHIYRNVAS